MGKKKVGNYLHYKGLQAEKEKKNRHRFQLKVCIPFFFNKSRTTHKKNVIYLQLSRNVFIL